MRLLLAAVGRLKHGPEAELVADYAQRIRRSGRALGFAEFSIVEIDAPERDSKNRILKEGELLLERTEGAFRIALDERGKSKSSAEFAELLARRRDEGRPSCAFLIGGADGLADSVKAACPAAISFGRATFPHLLVRVMLCEQIYRAMTILSGHPYHRA
jgi:23S rRNA (pseudouridine1915-N3)-methyltransferase